MRILSHSKLRNLEASRVRAFHSNGLSHKARSLMVFTRWDYLASKIVSDEGFGVHANLTQPPDCWIDGL